MPGTYMHERDHHILNPVAGCGKLMTETGEAYVAVKLE